MNLIGIIGSFLILLAFYKLQNKKWDSHGYEYLMANLIGSSLLVIYAISTMSYSFIVLNSVFAFVAIKSLMQRKR